MTTGQLLAEWLEPAAVPLPPQVGLDRYRGALLGLAAGNALGGAVEGFTVEGIWEVLPGGVRDIHPSEIGKPWDDDVAQAMELADCLLKHPSFDMDDYLERLLAWAEADGRGLGHQTRRVLIQAKAGARGTAAAWSVWEQSGRDAAGNGAVMRCAPVALRWRRDPIRLLDDAQNSAKATHYDPRCVWSTVAVCGLVARVLAGLDASIEELAAGLTEAGAPDEVAESVQGAVGAELLRLGLGEPDSMGYTLLPMAAAVWAIEQTADFESVLLQVVNAGGDTDTNGAVVGAVLGARYGAQAIPSQWLDKLYDRLELEALADRLWDAAEETEPLPPEDAPWRRTPLLYIDVDEALLGTAEPVDGAAEFLQWAAERFELRLLTRQAPSGQLDAAAVQTLAERLGVAPELLSRASFLPWTDNRLDVIDVGDSGRWWWVGGAADERELEVLRLTELESRWIDVTALTGRTSLSEVRRILESEMR